MTKSTLTLTESGLLALLLEHQRRKITERAQLRARREHLRSLFWDILRRLFRPLTLRTIADDSSDKRSVEIFPRQI